MLKGCIWGREEREERVKSLFKYKGLDEPSYCWENSRHRGSGYLPETGRSKFSWCTSRESRLGLLPPPLEGLKSLFRERFPVLICVSSGHLNNSFLTSHCHYLAVIIALVERKDLSLAFLLPWVSQNKQDCIHFPLFGTRMLGMGAGARRLGGGRARQWDEHRFVPHVPRTLS